MVRKKSINSKIKTRKEAYKRQSIRLRSSRSWKILILVMKAVYIFLSSRRDASIAARLPPSFGTLGADLIPSNCIGVVNNNIGVKFPDLTGSKKQFENFDIIQDVIKKLVSSVCRKEYERKKQLKFRKRKRSSDAIINNDQSDLMHIRQRNLLTREYSGNVLLRKKKKEREAKKFRYKYQNNNQFREKQKARTKKHVFEKYYKNSNFRDEHTARAKINMLDKYHNNTKFREEYKSRMKRQSMQKYNSNNLIRLKTIERALNRYRNNHTPIQQNRRRLYNQSRRILKKYNAIQSHTCAIKHRSLYMDNLKSFRKIIREGPDYICISCRLTFFRNQVIPFIEEKYIKENMSEEIKERIQSYLNHSLLTGKKWICKSCSDKIKKRQMPSRALVNKLEVREIPPELNKLNNLEKHLIALRLPFMKIVNLTSGKLSSRFSQKGTKGPLHCVPSDVQDTVTALPRPVDKSMMVRLQLKRRLQYKAVWEEQLINPHDVRDALIVLTRKHPGYKDIRIEEIDERYLESDKENTNETMDVDTNEGVHSIKEIELSTEDHLKRLSLGDIDIVDVDEDEEINEDKEDIRTKYNVGTDSCTQPCDFNDFLIFDKEPCVVAPAEKNKLSSLLTDKSIESLAFPHLFPDGRGSYDEDRVTDLKWKEYCKARLFSSDNRFAADSSYIFYLQYLGDLKQVFSGINVAFRKQLPMSAKQALDGMQMKFLMNKDMIYRYLQSVRGSPQYWCQRLKDLFGMTRQLGFPTFFVTLSCADLRWKEFVDTFVRHTGAKIKKSYTFEEKTKLLRANPVLAARLFEKRFTSFMNLFIKGGACCLGKVKDWFARIEMQLRGSPHSHMPLWVEGAPEYRGSETDEKTREEIVKFCDKYITTRFPSVEEDAELHYIIKEVQTHSRNHSKSCLKYHKTLCRFGFPRPIARRTFICEPIKLDSSDDKERSKKAKAILIEMNIALNALEKEKILSWLDFDNLLRKYNWTYDDYEWALRVVHRRPVMVYKREPNARWVNQYNEEMLRAWDANMDIQFVLDPYACAKYLMSYTTKPEREMSLLLEATHKECREGNMSVREEMKKLTGTFFNHRQVSVQEAIYRATKMPLTYSSRGFVFVPSHSNSCKFLKPHNVLKQMDPEDDNIYMSNLADKYFDRPEDPEFDLCMADFASNYEIISVNKNIKNPKTSIKRLLTLNFAVKKRCNRNAIIRYPYFNRETDSESYFENLLSLYLPIRSRNDLKKPYELFYETVEVFDARQECIRKVKDIVHENRKKYEAHFKETDEMESLFNQLSTNMKEDEWAEIVANKEKNNIWSKEIEEEENPDFNVINKRKNKSTLIDLKQTYFTTDEMRPLLESMNEEQQQIFYHVREWCINRLHNPDVEPLRLFITGGAGTGKSHLLKCLHYEATKIFSRKKHLEPDENIDVIHTLITAFTGAAAVNVGGVTIHSAFGIGTQLNNSSDNLSCDKLNSYRCKLGSLKLLFVDEVSLIQAGLWGAMHSRLTQIMGINSNTAIFGNISIVALGDFYQCSPVASSSIYSSLLWSDHFEYIELKINERQKSNICFSQMLNRIRQLKKKEMMTQEDRNTLEKCHQRYLNKEYHPEALHLFAKNAQVDAHNEQMIEKICTDIRTFYETDNNNKEIKPNKNKHPNKMNKPLRLAKNARVMITKNICVGDGLANGVIGRIVGFIENNSKEVSRIIIKCDLASVGRLHRVNCPHCHGKDTVCVTRESDNFDRQDYDLRSKKGTKQFPLRLSWAMTIHKAQGVTVDQIVISTKDLFGSGMGYTALARVRTLEGLFLIDLHLDKFYCNENVGKVLSQMKEMQRKILVCQDQSEFINILFHNIEGLKCNFNAFRNHHIMQKADLICLAETWLNDNHQLDDFRLTGYNLIHKTRSYSFASNHPLQSQKGGGVAIYMRETIPLKRIDSSKHLNLEFISTEIEEKDITIITCYRSPQQTKKEFLTNLNDYLQEINIEKHILLIGDFNEDTLYNKSKPIETYLEKLGFSNLFKHLSTTNSATSLDCIYSNFLSHKKDHQHIIGTFYSFHEALILSINSKKNNLYEYNEIISNNDNVMEIDYASNITSSNNITCFNSSKRKFIPRETNANKKFNNKNLSSITTDSNSNINDKQKDSLLKESTHLNKCPNARELDFLANIDKIISSLIIPTSQFTFSSLSEQLAVLNLYKIKIVGDGSCFFRAISHQLYGNQNKHRELRDESIIYLTRNNHIFAAAVSGQDRDIHDYILRMKKYSTYADHFIILATASVLRQNIIIHEYGKRPLIIPGSDFIDEQLHIAYDPNMLHYESVKDVNGINPFISFNDLQQT